MRSGLLPMAFLVLVAGCGAPVDTTGLFPATDGGTEPGSDGGDGGATDAGMSTPGYVYCQGAPCMVGQVCCLNSKDHSLDVCAAPGSCGQGFVELACNGPEDCPGQVCCGDHLASGGYSKLSCQATCTGTDTRIICEAHPAICPSGKVCKPSSWLGNGYSYCGAP